MRAEEGVASFSECGFAGARNKRATTIQSWVRMHQQRARFRRETDTGRRAGERAAAVAAAAAAATVAQKYARRVLALRKVCST